MFIAKLDLLSETSIIVTLVTTSDRASSPGALVGIDAINIDDPVEGGERPASSTLLAAGIPIVEHLTGLEQLPARRRPLQRRPPPIAGFTAFPVRAFAMVPE